MQKFLYRRMVNIFRNPHKRNFFFQIVKEFLIEGSFMETSDIKLVYLHYRVNVLL